MVSPSLPKRSPSAPVALTLAGSDSGANAGLQADLLTFAANGVYGLSAVTCLTAQNPTGVAALHAAPALFVSQQLESLSQYFSIGAAKTGMLFNQEIIEAASDFFAEHPQLPLVVDPVMVATSGKRLLQPEAITCLQERLLPLASVITPNLDEAEILVGRSLRSLQAIEAGAVELATRFNLTALIKGGHLAGDRLFDVVSSPAGETHTFEQSRIENIDTHGSGCTLSAAIAAHLSRGEDAMSAIAIARHYLRRAMLRPVHLSGERFINHFPA